jgi:rubredoxin
MADVARRTAKEPMERERMETTTTCPKCSGRMATGFVLDSSHPAILVSRWVAGLPQKSWLTGIKLPTEPLPITTFRCSSCGYLESYANPPVAAKP